MNTPNYPFWRKALLFSGLCLMIASFSACSEEEEDDDDNNTVVIPQAISCDDIETNTVWTNRGEGVDYTCDCIIAVKDELVIEAGVVIEFDTDAGLDIQSDGSLQAVGEIDNRIEFIGAVSTAGVWRGIYFRSNSVLNELNYVRVSHGGSKSFDGDNTKKAGIRVNNGAQLKLINSEVSSNSEAGLFVDGLDFESVNPLKVFSNNVFSNNEGYPVSIIAPTVAELDGTNSEFTGNDENKILIRGGRLFGDHEWKKQNVPYLIEEIVAVGYYDDEGNLTVEPGTVIEFSGNAGLHVGDYSPGSYLIMEGTASENIVLTGETQLAGAWRGLAISSNSPLNSLNYVEISYGGSDSYSGDDDDRGNLIVGASSEGIVTIENSTISNSAAYGIYISFNSDDITVPSSVTYSNNALGDYYHED